MNFMKGRCFLDTNILVYSFDNGNPEKQEISKSLLKELFESEYCFVSTQVISEFCNICIKKMQPPLNEKSLIEFILLIPENHIHSVTRNDI